MAWTHHGSTDVGAANGTTGATNSDPIAEGRCPMWYKKSPKARNRLICQLPSNHAGAHKYGYSRLNNSSSTLD